MLLISIKQCKNNNIIFIKKKTICKVEIESLQNKDYSNLISKKGTNQTKERKSLEIKNSINEFEVSLNENQRIMQNEDELISKKKLDTVREVNSEFSNRKNENKKQLNYNKTNSKKSSCTEKIDSEKRVENYYKKSQQLLKLFPKKKNNNNQNYEFFRARSYNIPKHNNNIFTKQNENIFDDYNTEKFYSDNEK